MSASNYAAISVYSHIAFVTSLSRDCSSGMGYVDAVV